MSPQQYLAEVAMSETEWHAARGVIELAAVAAGSISGALHGIRREYDLVGVTMIALSTGLGGGIIRDLLLAQGPVLALRHPSLLLTALVAALAGMLLGQWTVHLRGIFFLMDALAIGLFTVTGIQRAEEFSLRIIPALFLGVLAGTGGGMLRDVLCRETPATLTPGPPLAAAALLGGVTYYVVSLGLGWPVVVSEWLAILLVFVVRIVGTWRRWMVPKRTDVSDRLQTWRRGPKGTKPLRQDR